MNFAQTSAGSEGIDDSIDAKPQLLGFNNLAASVWSSQQKQPQQSISQDLLASSASSVIDVPFLPSAHNASNTSPQSSSSNGGNNANSNDGGDAEGVWSPDIDQAFHEALQIYPPCGRRKIILSDEGKMYGRNELIARYIKIRCGKTRTRKQVSSHIQVLARKKQREQQSRIKTNQDGTTDFPMESLQEPMAGTAPPSATSSSSPNPQLGGPDSVESTPSFNNNNISDISPQTSANLMNKSPNNREPIPAAASMHQKMIETASAISTSAISSMANPSPLNWPSYPLNRQNLLGNFNGQINGVQQLADRPPPSQELYSSIFALHPTMKTEPGAAGMVVVPGDMPPFSSLPCLPSSSSAPSNFTIASSNLVLCGFTAYIEQNLDGKGMVVDGENSRVEIVKIPTVSDTPLEEIRLSCVQSKYPQLLQDLFEKGPSNAFFLVKCWANMRFNSDDQRNSLFAVDSFYEASAKFDINVSTKVCSFGNEVVEKVEIYSPIDEDLEANPSKIWHFRLEKSPMCEYMVRFISKLKELQEPSLMNSVLENFTVLQIVTDRHTLDTLMVIAFIFEIREDGDDEISTNVYRIIK